MAAKENTMKLSLNPLLVIFFVTGIFTDLSLGFEPPRQMIGHWQGKGEIIVSWCLQDSLEFDLTIAEDGSVSGMIGGARLTDAHIHRNSWFLRLLKNPEFIVEGDLTGALVPEENILRPSVKYLLLDMESSNKLSGGMHTSGKHIGGKETMVLTVSGIRLKKQ